jgi:hypothetical protein
MLFEQNIRFSLFYQNLIKYISNICINIFHLDMVHRQFTANNSPGTIHRKQFTARAIHRRAIHRKGNSPQGNSPQGNVIAIAGNSNTLNLD